MRKTEITPWTEEWAKLYLHEEKILINIFENELQGIYHIGSTSVPPIGFAKPIIDILLVVNDLEKVEQYNEKMLSQGYLPRGENGISGRRYFPKGKDKRTHHLHIYQVGHENIKIHLDFKEYLLHNSDDAKAYGQLKIKLAEQFPDDTHKYQDGKEHFVNGLVDKATNWNAKRDG